MTQGNKPNTKGVQTMKAMLEKESVMSKADHRCRTNQTVLVYMQEDDTVSWHT